MTMLFLETSVFVLLYQFTVGSGKPEYKFDRLYKKIKVASYRASVFQIVLKFVINRQLPAVSSTIILG